MEKMPSSTQIDYSSLITTPISECDQPLDKDKPLDESEKSTVCENASVESSSTAIGALLNRLPDLGNYFHIHKKIGEGTFSNVYLASLKGLKTDKRFAIKHLIPTTHPKRIKYELECLTRIGGKDNVISCDMSLRNADCVVFIMPYLQHTKFADYVLEMDVEETRLYMKNLLVALRRVHSFNIIHRDIKPSNFLYNRASKKFLLVDFGLAHKVNEQDDNSRLKPEVPVKANTKRKREEDDLENAENPAVKRCALQTLSIDIVNKPGARPSVTIRYPKQPLSVEQRKCQQAQERQFQCPTTSKALKRLPLTTNSSNIIEHKDNTINKKQEFQNLLPQKVPVESGASFVRVQNSQVQAGLFPRPIAPVRRKNCDCDGKPQVCHMCLTRKAQYAPRAGTPGFRPPEVLLKYPNQTTAVDIWAAGVIMLCVLSGCYPFFRSPDDITALSEFITVFGSSAITALAKKFGRNVICSESRKPVNLRILCENFRQRKIKGSDKNKDSTSDLELQTSTKDMPVCEECYHKESPKYGCLCESKSKLDLTNTYFPESAFDLLTKLLDINPETRISAEKALEHPFITARN